MQYYTFNKIFQEVVTHKSTLIKANLIALLAVIMSVPVPLMMPILVDEILLDKPGWFFNTTNSVLGGPYEPYLYITLALLIAIILRGLYFLLSVWQNWHFNIISKSIIYKIRQDLLGHISKLSLSEYEHFGSGKISSLMVVDIGTVDTFLSSSISRLLISVLTIFGVGFVLVMIHWQLALFILLINPFIIFFTTKFARKVSKFKKEENAKIAIFQDTLNETLDLFWQVRASNSEKKFFNQLDHNADEIKDAAIAFGYKSDAAGKKSYMLFLTGFEIFRATGILMVAYSDLSIGLMFAVFGYLWVIMTPIQEIINIQYDYHNAKAALSRINAIFDLSAEPQYPHVHNPFRANSTNQVTLEAVNFAYDSDKPVLKDINVEIKKGSKIAIIGASGSGKTTLAHIIAGFYEANSGRVLFDGIDSKEIGLDMMRSSVFMVLQSPMMFNESIRFNLTFGKEITEDKIQRALQIAQLQSFINELADGVDTVVGKNGIKLSGGQRQRLSIARMIIADPNVVILDESTSSLDVSTEDSLFEELTLFLKERTTIIIAHRLSTINMADHIYVLENGQIQEEGSKEELLALDGCFAHYFNQGKQ
ncbi:MAG: ABC transporter ATP-binding protein/permease [Epsilonproteobacteria bacterium]|nr:ABC transporter ATP-binding protein/permease [Campylobacterota bacterium]